MTASIAFGGTFLRQGWLIGTARIAYRCLQLYAAQIGMFFAVAVVVVIGTHWYGDTTISRWRSSNASSATPRRAGRALHPDLCAALHRHPAALYRRARDGAIAMALAGSIRVSSSPRRSRSISPPITIASTCGQCR